jgi:iron complex outermembrane receptor protein
MKSIFNRKTEFMRKIFMLIVLLANVSWLFSQQISGKVVDGSNSEGIIHATVQLKAKLYGTITDERGLFNLQLPVLPATLVVSAVNFGTKAIVVTKMLTAILK